LEENKDLRKKLREKYKTHDQLKVDTVEDYKSLFLLQRQINFHETDFIIEREEKEKVEEPKKKAAMNKSKSNMSKSIITDRKSIVNDDMSMFEDRGVSGEEKEVNRRNTQILSRLRERLEATKIRDICIGEDIHPKLYKHSPLNC
jgi:hypothetical protein